MKSVFNIFIVERWFLAILFVCCLCGSVAGQGGAPPGSGPPPVINPRAEDRSRQLAEGRLRSAEIDAANESEKERLVHAAIANMREDFARIQVVRNDIARNLIAHKPLDYRLIEDQTGEIHKRAARLNVYIMAQGSGTKEQPATTDLKPEELVGALVKLCKLVDSFTENPALKNAATIDVHNVDKAKEEKAKADKDLLDIIKLSENLRKRSEELRTSN